MLPSHVVVLFELVWEFIGISADVRLWHCLTVVIRNRNSFQGGGLNFLRNMEHFLMKFEVKLNLVSRGTESVSRWGVQVWVPQVLSSAIRRTFGVTMSNDQHYANIYSRIRLSKSTVRQNSFD